jgi:hypothetical protein
MTKTVFVKFPEGVTRCVSIEQVSDLRAKVFALSGIPEHLQNYHHGGKPLGETLVDLSSVTLFLALQGKNRERVSLGRWQGRVRVVAAEPGLNETENHELGPFAW